MEGKKLVAIISDAASTGKLKNYEIHLYQNKVQSELNGSKGDHHCRKEFKQFLGTLTSWPCISPETKLQHLHPTLLCITLHNTITIL